MTHGLGPQQLDQIVAGPPWDALGTPKKSRAPSCSCCPTRRDSSRARCSSSTVELPAEGPSALTRTTPALSARLGPDPLQRASNPPMSRSPGDTPESIGHIMTASQPHGYIYSARTSITEICGRVRPLDTATARLMNGWPRRPRPATAWRCWTLARDGGPAVDLARQWGCRVTGITISDVGLGHARRRAEPLGVADRVRFLHADGTEMACRRQLRPGLGDGVIPPDGRQG